jgi:hypothetical protein
MQGQGKFKGERSMTPQMIVLFVAISVNLRPIEYLLCLILAKIQHVFVKISKYVIGYWIRLNTRIMNTRCFSKSDI